MARESLNVRHNKGLRLAETRARSLVHDQRLMGSIFLANSQFTLSNQVYNSAERLLYSYLCRIKCWRDAHDLGGILDAGPLKRKPKVSNAMFQRYQVLLGDICSGRAARTSLTSRIRTAIIQSPPEPAGEGPVHHAVGATAPTSEIGGGRHNSTASRRSGRHARDCGGGGDAVLGLRLLLPGHHGAVHVVELAVVMLPRGPARGSRCLRIVVHRTRNRRYW